MSLPPEIWRHVGQYLSLADWKRIYCVNRLFFDLSMDVQYHNIVFGNINTLMIHQLGSLRSPEIAARVRSFSIPSHVLRNHCEKAKPPPRSPSSLENAFRRLFRRPKRDPKREECAAITESIVRTIPLMSNVKGLTISWSGGRDCPAPYLEVAWRTFFPNLIELDLTITPVLATHIGTLPPPSFPRLESLTLSFDEGPDPQAPPWIGLEKCQMTLAFLVTSTRSTLTKLQVRVSPPQPLTDLFSRLPLLEKLVILGVEVTTEEAIDTRSLPIVFIERHATGLQELYIRVGDDDKARQRPWALPYSPFCLKNIHLPKLKTLTISAKLISSLRYEQEVLAFFAAHVYTLRRLDIRGCWPASRYSRIECAGLHTVLDQSCSLTSLYLDLDYLQASLLDLLATTLPQLENLTLKTPLVFSNTWTEDAAPSDIFPKWYEVAYRTHPMVEEIRQYTSLKEWALRDISIKRNSCCGVLILWGLMHLCAQHIPSIRSFVNNGNMVIPSPPNVPPGPSPTVRCNLTRSPYCCTYGKDYTPAWAVWPEDYGYGAY